MGTGTFLQEASFCKVSFSVSVPACCDKNTLNDINLNNIFLNIFLCKIAVQRSKYWLEMSKASEKVKNVWITVPLVLDVRIQINQTGFKIIEKRETH